MAFRAVVAAPGQFCKVVKRAKVLLINWVQSSGAHPVCGVQASGANALGDGLCSFGLLSDFVRWRSRSCAGQRRPETRFGGVAPGACARRLIRHRTPGGFMSGSDCTSACTASSMDGPAARHEPTFGLVAAYSSPCRYGQFVIALRGLQRRVPMVASCCFAAHALACVRIAANHRAEQTGQCC